MAQMKEQHKTPEKELNKSKITNLSDAEFKTLVIRILKEITGYCNSIKKTQAEMKVALSEIKKNLQGTTVEGKKLRIKTIWNIRKKKVFNQNSKKKKERIRSLWDISKHTNIQIIGRPEGEDKEQEIENF